MGGGETWVCENAPAETQEAKGRIPLRTRKEDVGMSFTDGAGGEAYFENQKL